MSENGNKKSRPLRGLLKSFSLNHAGEAAVVNLLPPARVPAYITKEAIVDGSLNCDGDIVIEGVVNGDITGSGSVKISSGKVKGNVKGSKIETMEAEVIGDIEADGYLMVSGGMIQGSVTANKADINGLIKGNISTSDMLVIQHAASIEGDIKTASISVAQNAVINGKVTIVR